jgi:uncharacterized protein (DUF427 family)
MSDSLQVSKAYHDHQSTNFIIMEPFDDDDNNNNATGMPNSADVSLAQVTYKRVNLDSIHATSQSLITECDLSTTYYVSYTKLREVYFIRSNSRSRCQ